MSVLIEPFHIAITESQLDDLTVRLGMARLPDQLPGVGWEAGVDYAYMRDLVDYWRDQYDWRAAEVRLNEFHHFKTTVDGQTIHFIHERSDDPNAFPLLLLHGWPGSVVEFLDLIEELRQRAQGGQAFHLVVPSLPGYAFSSPLVGAGWTLERMAKAFAELMARLGYSLYGVQGGDWGAMITHTLALVDETHVAAIHTNLPIADATGDLGNLSDDDRRGLDRSLEFVNWGGGYAAIQGTRPQTIGLALDNSPIGLCGWIAEKFHDWSDIREGFEKTIPRDALLTNVMLYWLTGTAMSAARLYYESARQAGGVGMVPKLPRRVETPTGVARFAFEIFQPPRPWVEAQFNIVHWSEFDRGGHFAAMEQPQLMAADIRKFFASYGATARQEGSP